jgi:hypothetical protein
MGAWEDSMNYFRALHTTEQFESRNETRNYIFTD